MNNNDIVTRVPPAYKHIGSLRHFTAGGKMLTEPSTWRVEMDRIWGRIRFRAADGIRDHNMDDYIRLIEGQL